MVLKKELLLLCQEESNQELQVQVGIDQLADVEAVFVAGDFLLLETHVSVFLAKESHVAESFPERSLFINFGLLNRILEHSNVISLQYALVALLDLFAKPLLFFLMPLLALFDGEGRGD